MDKPSGLQTLTLDVDAPVDDRCDMAKRAWNSASRAQNAYRALFFVMAVALVVAVIYAVVSFNDEVQSRGILGLVAAAGSLLTSGVFATLAKSASEDEKAMWARVEKSCGAGAGGPGAQA